MTTETKSAGIGTLGSATTGCTKPLRPVPLLLRLRDSRRRRVHANEFPVLSRSQGAPLLREGKNRALLQRCQELTCTISSTISRSGVDTGYLSSAHLKLWRYDSIRSPFLLTSTGASREAPVFFLHRCLVLHLYNTSAKYSTNHAALRALTCLASMTCLSSRPVVDSTVMETLSRSSLSCTSLSYEPILRAGIVNLRDGDIHQQARLAHETRAARERTP